MLPFKVVVMSVSKKFDDYALKVHKDMMDAGFQVDIDISDRKLHSKVRDAQGGYACIVGSEEEGAGSVTIRDMEANKVETRSVQDAISFFRKFSVQEV